MIITRNRVPGKRGFNRVLPKGVAVLALSAFIMVLSASMLPAEADAEASVSVLCYHSFLEKKKMDPYSFTIDELKEQITQLKKEGFRFVSINDVVSGRLSGTRNVLITVDDGNKSVYEAHQKVFRPNGIRPLLGIYPNIIINKKHYALTWEQLAELANSGCDIAAHGYFHLKVNKKLHDQKPSYFKKEIYLVKKVLEEKLNRKVTVFVYPFGLRDDLTIKTLREAGYRYAFTINNGRIDIPLGGGEKSFELPRYMVTRTSWKYCFNSIMRNARHKTAYKVAAAGGASMEKDGMTVMDRAPAERHDPAAELHTRLTERMDKTALADLKAEKNNKQMKDSRVKKKIEKKTGIDSDSVPAVEKKKDLIAATPVREREQALARRNDAKTPDIFGPVSHENNPSEADRKSIKRKKLVFPADELRSAMAPPIQKVASSVKRDSLGLEKPDIFPVEKRRASLVSVDGLSFDRRESAVNETAGTPDSQTALEARVVKGTNPYLSKMKDRYHGINSKSVRTYHGFLGLVSDKIERIKHTIRKYVLSHF